MFQKFKFIVSSFYSKSRIDVSSFFAGVTVFAVFFFVVGAFGDERPNILLINLETFRHDHSAISGYSRDTTPNLDGLASKGVRFTRMISASNWTMPSVMTLMTSLHPSFHAVKDTTCSLAENIITLSGTLTNAGYQAAAFVSNPLLSSRFGYGTGFDFYDDFSMNFDADAESLLSVTGSSPSKAFHQRRYSPMITRMAQNWLTSKRESGKPFFLYLFYFDPHYDYVPPEPYRSLFTDPDYDGDQDGRNITSLAHKRISDADKKHVVALYDGELRYADNYIGKLLSFLEEMSLFDNTIILVLGDHGDEFWEHGSVAHGHTLFDELVRVPFFIRYPDKIKPNTVVNQQVTFIDVMPTILGLAGVPIPNQCAGQNLLPLIRGENTPELPAIMESIVHRNELLGVRSSEQKIIMNHGVITAMYSLKDDPGEILNLLDSDRRGEFETLEKALDSYVSQIGIASKDVITKQPKLDPELIKQLKSLGYMR